jgi:hypothetical protein
VCGETPENREAWERYGRTVDLENSEYRRMDDEDDSPDDLPGVKAGRLSPPTGAAADSAGSEHGSPPTKAAPPPANGGRNKRSDAPAPPPQKQPEPEEPITDEQQDELVELASMAGMKTSALKKHVTEAFGVADPALLTSKQASLLMTDLKKRAQ